MEKEHWSLRIGRPLAHRFEYLIALSILPILCAILLNPESYAGVSHILRDPLGIAAAALFLVSAVSVILILILLVCMVPRMREQMHKDREELDRLRKECSDA